MSTLHGPASLLQSLSDEQKQLVLDHMSPVEVPTGSQFISEGEIGDSFYIIVEGTCDVYITPGSMQEQFLAEHGPGDFLGEASLFDPNGRRTASVRARTNMKLLCMTLEEFDALLHQEPHLAYTLARLVSQRERNTNLTTIRELAQTNRALEGAYKELKSAQEQLIEKEIIEKELEVARTIQQSILPRQLPEVSGYSLGAIMCPARQVGGDLFDFIPLDAGKLGILIGDVSDKGVPAALYMAVVRSLVRAEAVHTADPAAVLQTTNKHLLDMGHVDMFVTILYGILDLEQGAFHYARAGHEIPLLFDAAGTPVEVRQGRGMLLGVFPDPELDEQTIQVPTGGTLLLYSDGATDMLNPSGKQFGLAFLIQAVQDNQGSSAQGLCTSLLDMLQTFQGQADQADDVTLVAVRA